MAGNCSDADHHAVAVVHCVVDLRSDLVQLIFSGTFAQLLDERHIRLADVQHKIVLPVWEQALHLVDQRGIRLVQLAQHKNAARHLSGHMQFFRPHINIPQQDIIRDNILDKRPLVVLFLIVRLCGIQCHSGHGAHSAADAVLPTGKHGVIKPRAPASQRFKRLSVQHDGGSFRRIDGRDIFWPFFSDPG